MEKKNQKWAQQYHSVMQVMEHQLFLRTQTVTSEDEEFPFLTTNLKTRKLNNKL